MSTDDDVPSLDGVHHLKLPVADLDRTARWYSSRLGYRPMIRFTKGGQDTGLVMVHDDGGPMLSFVRDPSVPSESLTSTTPRSAYADEARATSCGVWGGSDEYRWSQSRRARMDHMEAQSSSNVRSALRMAFLLLVNLIVMMIVSISIAASRDHAGADGSFVSATPFSDGAVYTMIVVVALVLMNGAVLCLNPTTRRIGAGAVIAAVAAVPVGVVVLIFSYFSGPSE